MNKDAAKHIGEGLCWLGFWIGLGLFNFQGMGCSVKGEPFQMVREISK